MKEGLKLLLSTNAIGKIAFHGEVLGKNFVEGLSDFQEVSIDALPELYCKFISYEIKADDV